MHKDLRSHHEEKDADAEEGHEASNGSEAWLRNASEKCPITWNSSGFSEQQEAFPAVYSLSIKQEGGEINRKK